MTRGSDVRGGDGVVARAAQQRPGGRRAGGHLGVESTIGDLLRHPAFAGFARLILPWDDRAYDEQMPLTRIGSLLPYHSHVDPETVASALNRMIDEAARGKTVFYRFYSEAQRQQEPAREQHGTVLLPRTSRRAVRGRLPRRRILLCRLRPRGLSVCRGDQQQGIQRLRPEVPGRAWRHGRHPGSGGGGLLHSSQRSDARRQHQRLLAVGQFGWSEDGRRDRFARSGELWRRRRSQAVDRRHGVHGAFGSTRPPSLPRSSWWVEQDGIAPPAIMERRVEALRKSGTPVEYHKYENLGHGFGLGTRTSAEGWVFEAIRFWETSIGRSGRECMTGWSERSE